MQTIYKNRHYRVVQRSDDSLFIDMNTLRRNGAGIVDERTGDLLDQANDLRDAIDVTINRKREIIREQRDRENEPWFAGMYRQ